MQSQFHFIGLGNLPPAAAVASVALMPSAAQGGASLTWSMASPLTTPAVAATTTSQVLLPNTSRAGFSLSPASEPFPKKLVDKIRSGQFVEMRELLTDNISLIQQLEAFGTHTSLPTLPGVLRPSLREVSSLQTWMYCFLAYTAIRAPDQDTRDRLAYARLLIQEAQRHGSTGWLDYDRVFRQQVAFDDSMRWNTLHPGIQAATLFGRAQGPGTFCTLCREPDHGKESCALTYFQQPSSLAAPTLVSTGPSQRPRGLPRRRSERDHFGTAAICRSWNSGACVFPSNCNYQHVCSICYQRHKARDCPAAARGSEVQGASPRRSPRSNSGPLPYQGDNYYDTLLYACCVEITLG